MIIQEVRLRKLRTIIVDKIIDFKTTPFPFKFMQNAISHKFINNVPKHIKETGFVNDTWI